MTSSRRLLKLIPITFVTLFAGILLQSCSSGNIEVSSNPVKVKENKTKPTINVYLENSGSMDGYMCDGSQLKDAVYDYLSEINGYSKTIRLNYINSCVIPFKGSINQYIKTLTPASFHAAGGNTSSSDMATMITTIIEQLDDSSVAIFISDCILDLPVSDSQKFLSNAQIAIKNAINEGRKRVPDLGVEILRLSSDFSGKYFYPNGQIDTLSNVKRPYYIWIIGKNSLLAELNKNVPLTDLEKHGFENMVAFNRKVEIPFDIKNKSLASQSITPANGNYTTVIRADFGATLQPETEIQNAKNYSFTNDMIKVESVKPIVADKNQYTHYITFNIPASMTIAEERLSFEMPGVPKWVREYNDETGKNINDNLEKTTGIKSLIGGVADAYKKDLVSAEFKFKVKRN